MSGFTIAAVALAAGFVPCGVAVLRGDIMRRVVALELASLVGTLVLLLIAIGQRQTGAASAALALALLSFPTGLLFSHFFGRWL